MSQSIKYKTCHFCHCALTWGDWDSDFVTFLNKQAHGYFELGDEAVEIQLCTSGFYIGNRLPHTRTPRSLRNRAATSNYSHDGHSTALSGRGTVGTHYGHAVTGVGHIWQRVNTFSREQGCTVTQKRRCCDVSSLCLCNIKKSHVTELIFLKISELKVGCVSLVWTCCATLITTNREAW